MSGKHAKYVQREYESVNDACAKYFKRVAKEEKSYEEAIDLLDAKVKKAHATHEKNATAGKRGSLSIGSGLGTTKAIESHDKYIATVSSLTQEIASVKQNHASSLGGKSHLVLLKVASCLGGLADAEFRAHCERVRATGPLVGRVNEWLNFAIEVAMPALQPTDLTEEALGPAAVLAAAEAQAELHAAHRAAVEAQAAETAQLEWAARQMGWVPPEEKAQIEMAQQQQPLQPKQAEAKSASTSTPTQETAPRDPSATSSQSVTSTEQTAALPKLDSNGDLVTESRPQNNAPTSAAASEERLPRRQNSSVVDGTIIENAEPPGTDDADTHTPALSTSDSRTASDGASVPRTPSALSQILNTDGQRAAKETAGPSSGGILGPLGFETVHEEPTRRGSVDPVRGSAATPPGRRSLPTPGAQSMSAPMVQHASQSAIVEEYAKEPAAPPYPSSGRQNDMQGSEWQTSTIRQKQQQRQASIEEQYRDVPKVLDAPSIEERYHSPREEVTPRGSASQQQSWRPVEAPVNRWEQSRSSQIYSDKRARAPIAPVQPQAPGEDLSRRRSTDSERSFVARMKAKYQASKSTNAPAPMPQLRDGSASWQRDAPAGGHYQHRAQENDKRASYTVGPRYSEPPRQTPPPHRASFDHAPRRSEDRYAPEPDATWRQPTRRAYESLPFESSGRPAQSAARAGPPPSEFGARDSREHGPPSGFASAGSGMSASGRAQPAPVQEEAHPDVCGCATCSARNYGSIKGRPSQPSHRESFSAGADSYRARPPQESRGDPYFEVPRQAERHYERRAEPPAQQRGYSLPPSRSSDVDPRTGSAAASYGELREYDGRAYRQPSQPRQHVGFVSQTETVSRSAGLSGRRSVADSRVSFIRCRSDELRKVQETRYEQRQGGSFVC